MDSYLKSSIMDFVNEILYGFDGSPVPQESFHWKIYLFEKIIDKDLELPLAYEHYLKQTSLELPKNISKRDRALIFQQIPQIIDLIKAGSEKMDLNIIELISLHLYSDCEVLLKTLYEINTSLLRNFHQILLPDSALEEYVFVFNDARAFIPESFMNRMPNNSKFLTNLLEKDLDIRTLTALYRKLNVDTLSKYFWTRDYHLNLFNLEHFKILVATDVNGQEYLKKLILRISKLTNPKILHQHIFHQIIKSGIYDFQVSDSLITDIFESNHLSMHWETIFKEFPKPVNMFLPIKNIDKCIHIFQQSFSTEEPDKFTLIKIRAYIQSLKTTDPMPLFFIHIRYLVNFQELIVDKFDLTRLYFVDENFANDVLMNKDYKINFKKFQGKNLSFEQIVKASEIDDLWKIFSSQSSCNFEGVVDNSDSEPIPLSKYLRNEIDI